MCAARACGDRGGGAAVRQGDDQAEPGGALGQGGHRGLWLPAPMIRSPSQWPGTARSAASAGRSLMLIMPGIMPRALGRAGGAPRRRVRAGRTDRGRDLGAQAALALHEQRLVDRLVAHLQLPAGAGGRVSACPRSAPVNNPPRSSRPPRPAPGCPPPACAAGTAAPAPWPGCAQGTPGTGAAKATGYAAAPATPSTGPAPVRTAISRTPSAAPPAPPRSPPAPPKSAAGPPSPRPPQLRPDHAVQDHPRVLQQILETKP